MARTADRWCWPLPKFVLEIVAFVLGKTNSRSQSQTSPSLDLAPEQFQFQPALLGGDKFGLSARKGACGSVKGDAVAGK